MDTTAEFTKQISLQEKNKPQEEYPQGSLENKKDILIKECRSIISKYRKILDSYDQI